MLTRCYADNAKYVKEGLKREVQRIGGKCWTCKMPTRRPVVKGYTFPFDARRAVFVVICPKCAAQFSEDELRNRVLRLTTCTDCWHRRRWS